MDKKWAAKLPDGTIIVRRGDRLGMFSSFGMGAVYTEEEAKQLRADIKAAIAEEVPKGVKLGEGEAGVVGLAAALAGLVGNAIDGSEPEPDCDCPLCSLRRAIEAAVGESEEKVDEEPPPPAQDGPPEMPAAMKAWLERHMPGKDFKETALMRMMLQEVFGLSVSPSITLDKL